MRGPGLGAFQKIFNQRFDLRIPFAHGFCVWFRPKNPGSLQRCRESRQLCELLDREPRGSIERDGRALRARELKYV